MEKSGAWNVVIADDHDIVRIGLRAIIENNPDLHLAAEAADGKELLEVLKTTPCHLVILDLSMPVINGFEAIAEIKRLYPKLKIIVLTMHNDFATMKKVLKMGIVGYILKEDLADKLGSAIKDIKKGDVFISGQMVKYMVMESTQPVDQKLALQSLTKREKEILKLIVKGVKSKEVADSLHISVHTVSTHRANIMEKLNVKSMAELVQLVVAHGVF